MNLTISTARPNKISTLLNQNYSKTVSKAIKSKASRQNMAAF